MTIYVTDANIFIDLIYASLLDRLSLLELQLATTQLILDELETEQQAAIQELVDRGSLVVHEVGIMEISALTLPNGLSLPDKSVLCLALQNSDKLLSGDGLVRRTAQNMGIQVYGLLWLFDSLVAAKIITPVAAAAKLVFLVEEKGSRQPTAEYHRRIEQWKKM